MNEIYNRIHLDLLKLLNWIQCVIKFFIYLFSFNKLSPWGWLWWALLGSMDVTPISYCYTGTILWCKRILPLLSLLLPSVLMFTLLQPHLSPGPWRNGAGWASALGRRLCILPSSLSRSHFSQISVWLAHSSLDSGVYSEVILSLFSHSTLTDITYLLHIYLFMYFFFIVSTHPCLFLLRAFFHSWLYI